ncbi:peptide/nickel transport system permease protein [Litoreibacter meonggei]|uniref:Peptide/nickel transport system permease protein n=2 Tax=Litoreibacter meonggei TaxID=1049199 RepID=A0A497X3W3_9RHOB|nr:peptide/nickel transport system permease protein [Litoreibacter meonggei]
MTLADTNTPQRTRTASLLRLARKNKLSAFGLLMFTLIVLASIFAPFISPHDPLDQNILDRLQDRSAEYILGTDTFGRDTFTRILYGLRVSLMIGLTSTFLAMVLGCSLGIIAGYRGGWVDSLIMRVMDMLLAFPTLITGLFIVAVLGANFVNIVLAITVTILPKFARVARAPTIALKEREFVEAARALGYSDIRIMAVHIAPNILGEVVVLASLWAAYAIRIEAYLSFIGLGVAPPTPTLGTMIRDGFNHILDAPFVSIYPGFAVLLVVLSLNLVGDGLRDAIDPKLRD